ncbi:hypothetical protein M3Y97_00048400 [Aphelenchoides bicaudatus]|nr:hypothetical protein M3Y97_00048400 [Aphelenchoides bicaudatus]
MKITELLENILRSINDIQSILLVDRDGVPIVSAGNEVRNRSQLTAAFTSSLEQATKLNLGEQKSWVFHYESYQLVILNIQPISVFIIAGSNTNTSLLCQLRSRLIPAVEECKKLIAEVKNN